MGKLLTPSCQQTWWNTTTSSFSLRQSDQPKQQTSCILASWPPPKKLRTDSPPSSACSPWIFFLRILSLPGSTAIFRDPIWCLFSLRQTLLPFWASSVKMIPPSWEHCSWLRRASKMRELLTWGTPTKPRLRRPLRGLEKSRTSIASWRLRPIFAASSVPFLTLKEALAPSSTSYASRSWIASPNKILPIGIAPIRSVCPTFHIYF